MDLQKEQKIMDLIADGYSHRTIAKEFGCSTSTVSRIRNKKAKKTKKKEAKAKRRKRILAIADFHCGHVVGLTPPDWQWNPKWRGKDGKFAKYQREVWGWFAKQIDDLRPIDILFVNGDAVEGKGGRSGGTELITPDREEQTAMADDIIKFIQPQKCLMTYGTPYHTGKEEDWESVLLSKVKSHVPYAYLEGHAFPEINGLQFDVKHKIGSSSVPHGRWTALAKDKLWNTIWNSRAEQQPNSGVLIRSHVHYHVECSTPYWRAMTLPALQGFGSKYGVRQCSGTVDIGLVVFDVETNGDYKWQLRKALLPQMKVESLKL